METPETGSNDEVALTFPRVTEIMKISDTAEGNGVYLLEIKIQYKEDEEPEMAHFLSRPTDPYGVNPQIRQWLSENPGAPVHVYVPPPPLTAEERRAVMPTLSPYQFRMGLLSAGLLSQIEPAIEGMPEPAKSEAMIAWEYATYFERTNKFVALLAPALGLTDEQVDDLWASASAL